jgi:hypothetical protein
LPEYVFVLNAPEPIVTVLLTRMPYVEESVTRLWVIVLELAPLPARRTPASSCSMVLWLIVGEQLST